MSVRRRAGDERGYVMAVVVVLLMVVLLLGTAGLAETQADRSLTSRDGRERRAQQAADAGIQSVLYQQAENRIGNANSSYDLNGGLLDLTHSLDCIVPQLNVSLQLSGLVTANVNSAGVCPPEDPGSPGGGLTPQPTALGGHGFEEAEYIPGATTPVAGASEVDLAPKIVALGWDNAGAASTGSWVFSREEAILAPISPLPVLGANGNLTVEGVSLAGGVLGPVLSALGRSSLATTVNGDLEAVGDMTLPGIDAGLNPTLSDGLLGVVKFGGTLSPDGGIVIAQQAHTRPANRDPVTIAGAAVEPSCPGADPSVPRLAGCADFATFYDAGSDTVNVPSGQTMTIPGGDYVFCNFAAAGAVDAAANATVPVRIFIDNPHSARCGGNGPTLSWNSTFAHDELSEGNLTASSGITSAAPGNPSAVQIYVAGDGAQSPYDDDTFVLLGSPGQSANGLLSTNPLVQSLVAYAPTSEVSMTTAQCVNVPLLGTYCVPGEFTGNLIGDEVTATALTFTQDLDLGNLPLYDGVNVFHVQQYVQCTSQPTDAGGNTYSSLQLDPVIDTNGC